MRRRTFLGLLTLGCGDADMSRSLVRRPQMNRRGIASSGSALALPATIAGLAFWEDPTRQAWSDTAATVPATYPAGTVRRIDQALPSVASWLSASDAERPLREVGALRYEPLIAPGSGWNISTPSGVTLPSDGATIAGTYINRECPSRSNTQVLFSGKDTIGGQHWGLYHNSADAIQFFVANGVSVNTGLSSFLSNAGDVVRWVARWSTTACKFDYTVNGGTQQSLSVAASPAAGRVAGSFFIGRDGASTSAEGLHGSVGDQIGYSNAISDADTAKLLTYLNTRAAPSAFPLDQTLMAGIGDSHLHGAGLTRAVNEIFTVLATALAAGKNVHLLNAGKTGWLVANAQADYTAIALPQLSASRTKNVVLVDVGTNDIRAGTTTAAQLLTSYYAMIDNIKSTAPSGTAIICWDMLPRNDAGLRADFETNRTTFNADLAVNLASHGGTLVQVSLVANIGPAGSTANPTYYQADLVHLTATGAALEAAAAYTVISPFL